MNRAIIAIIISMIILCGCENAAEEATEATDPGVHFIYIPNPNGPMIPYLVFY